MDNWEIVRVFADEEEAVLAAGYLRSNDVPAEVEPHASTELRLPLAEDFGDYRVLVPADRLSEALTLLDERDAAAPAPEPGSAPAEPGPLVEEPSPVKPE
jgi:hypothetical protein